jgi:hypothetical protein
LSAAKSHAIWVAEVMEVHPRLKSMKKYVWTLSSIRSVLVIGIGSEESEGGQAEHAQNLELQIVKEPLVVIKHQVIL